jgi:hypothetical protein
MVVEWVVKVKIKRKHMTNAQKTYKKQLIQKIQISKHNVFIDNEMRKEFMLSRFGVDSTTKLSIDELKLLLDFCNRKVSDIPISKATEAQIYKICTLWDAKARSKTVKALLEFIETITSLKLKNIRHLPKHEATKVIIALENMK